MDASSANNCSSKTKHDNHEGTIPGGTKVRLQIQLLSIFVETMDMRALGQIRDKIQLLMENLYGALDLRLYCTKIELRDAYWAVAFRGELVVSHKP